MGKENYEITIIEHLKKCTVEQQRQLLAIFKTINESKDEFKLISYLFDIINNTDEVMLKV